MSSPISIRWITGRFPSVVLALAAWNLADSPPSTMAADPLGLTIANYLEGWSDSNLTLLPGEGFFARNRATSPVSLAFVGEVVLGISTNRLSSGYALCASILPPTGGDLSSTDFPAGQEDAVLFWNPAINSLDPAIYYFQGIGWIEGGMGELVYPTPGPGQAFWSYKSALATSGKTGKSSLLTLVSDFGFGTLVPRDVNGFASFSVGSPAPPCSTLPAGVVSWWRGEGDASDWMGLHSGVAVNGATFAPGLIGQAFSFDGVDDYVDVGPWVPGNQWTLEAWVNPAGMPPGRHTFMGGVDECTDWGLIYQDGRLGLTVRPPGGCAVAVLAPELALEGNWHHVAATCDGLMARLYVNGEFKGSAAVETNYVGTSAGTQLGSAHCCPADSFAGLVDEAAVYDRPLSEGELLAIYTAAQGGKCLPPRILVPPQDQDLSVGATANFSVSAAGEDPLTYQWQFAGVNIPGANSSSYSKTDVQHSDAGLYTVVVTGANGLANRRVASLTVADQNLLSGALKREVWFNIPFERPESLTNNLRYRTQPDLVETITRFETPASYANNYGQRLSGRLAPPLTGDYTFYLSSDDLSELYLSSDEDPGHAVRICLEPAWNGWRDWTGQARRPAGENISAPVHLQAGQFYYIAVVMKEGGGGDHLSVAWQKPGDPVPAPGSEPIPGTYLSHELSVLAPSIATPPQSLIVAEGSSASFRVLATGTLPLEYQWYWETTPLPGATNPVLTVAASPANAGSYSVTVFNSAGSDTSASTPALLTVAEAGLVPGALRREVWTQVTGVLLTDLTGDFRYYGPPNETGTVALFEAPVNIADRYGQRLSGLLIPPLTGSYTFYLSGDDQAALYLSSDDSWANRELICTEPVWNGARDWTGTARRPMAENISAPIFLEAGVPRYVEALMKEEGGGDNLAVAWQAPGDPVPAPGSSPIPGQFLAYTVPLMLPTITTQPQSQSLLAGANTVLTVASSGLPPLTYQWRFNLVDIPGATSMDLPLSNIQPSQAGSYQVVISNAYGSVTSAVAQVTVLPCPGLPPGLVGWWRGDNGASDAVGGHHGSLVNGATLGPGLVNQAFLLDGFNDHIAIPHAPDLAFPSSFTVEGWIQPVSLGNSPVLFEKGLNILNRVGLQITSEGRLGGYIDGGTYSAVSMPGAVGPGRFSHVAFVFDNDTDQALVYVNGNPVGSGPETRVPLGNNQPLLIGQSATAPGLNFNGAIDEWSHYNRALAADELRFIFLRGAAGKCASSAVPTLLAQPSSQTVLAGEAASFSVVATGLPEPTYQWRRNGIALPGANQASLIIVTAQAADAGTYSVLVSNVLGRVTSLNATLSVLSPPLITLQPQSQTVPTGTTVTFRSAASGSAPLGYQWLFEGNDIPGATSSTLMLPNVLSLAGGAYRMRASNGLGSATSDPAFLSVLDPPGILVAPTATIVLIGDSTELCVTASGTPPLYYLWRKNGVNLTESPQENSSCYSIASANPADGGSYSVVILNPVGLTATSPVSLVVELSELTAGDNFVDRVLLEENVVRASNIGATKEAGEPDHAGQSGGSSVWYRRVAGQDGVATIRTSGSAFDTLLAVYTGPDLANLALVADSEDEAGFFASEVRFNATQGKEYQIAVDGFDGASGDFVISWELEVAPPLPTITLQPQSQTVPLGATVQFMVEADDGLLNTFQWLFNGMELDGQTSPTLSLLGVTAGQVGQYQARVVNEFFQTVLSQTAVLEIGDNPNVQSADKVSNPTLKALTQPLAGGKGPSKGPNAISTGGVLVGAGTTSSQILSTAGSFRQAGEPNHCGKLGAATRWLVLQPQVDGLQLRLDTQGSLIPTILAVYSRAIVLEPLVEVACASGNDSLQGITFPVSSSLDYWVAVDGLDGAQGIIQLNWQLGTPPSLASAAEDVTVALGDALRWEAEITDGFPEPQFQWRLNGRDLEGATGSIFSLDLVQPGDAGVYSVVASNLLGQTEQTVATLTVDDSNSVLAKSDFESSLEDWSVVGDASTTTPQQQAGTGVHGAFAWHSDQGDPATWYWAAPQIYRGNQSAGYSGWLRFDLFQSPTSQSEPGPVVALWSAGRKMVCALGPAVATQWTTYEVALHESGGWRMESLGGPVPTQRDVLSMLSAVDQWWIQGDYSPEPHGTSLDRVRLIGPTETEVTILTVRMLAGGEVMIEWPEGAAAFQLEGAAEAGDGTWLPIASPPQSQDGLRRVIAGPMEGPFFRLRRH